MNCPDCGAELTETALTWEDPTPKPLQLVCMACPERFFVWDFHGARVFLKAAQYDAIKRDRHFARMLRWLGRTPAPQKE